MNINTLQIESYTLLSQQTIQKQLNLKELLTSYTYIVVYSITFAEQYIHNLHSISYIRCRSAIYVVYPKGDRSFITVSQCMGMGVVILYNTIHKPVKKIQLIDLYRIFLSVVSTPCNYETKPAPILENKKPQIFRNGARIAIICMFLVRLSASPQRCAFYGQLFAYSSTSGSLRAQLLRWHSPYKGTLTEGS